MYGGKSLLAVTVMENIEHKCPNTGCDLELPLQDVKGHKVKCDYRPVCCPAPACDQKIPFLCVIDHILNVCDHSYARLDGEVIDLENIDINETKTKN